MKITLVAERPSVANVAANLATIKRYVSKAKGDLVVFGELFLQGYMAKDRHVELAVSVAGPEFKELREIARKNKRNIILGFGRRDDERRGIVYDSAALVTRDGRVEVYDKFFLANFGPFEEKLFFAAGNRAKTFLVDGVRIGIEICYDLFFPELTKAYAVQGADVLVNISASPTTSRALFETLFPARALETGCFFVYCNVAGSQEDIVFWGGSQVWGPRGDLKAKSPTVEPSVLETEIDLAEVEAVRPLRPTIRDTRTELVDALRDSLASLRD